MAFQCPPSLSFAPKIDSNRAYDDFMKPTSYPSAPSHHAELVDNLLNPFNRVAKLEVPASFSRAGEMKTNHFIDSTQKEMAALVKSVGTRAATRTIINKLNEKAEGVGPYLQRKVTFARASTDFIERQGRIQREGYDPNTALTCAATATMVKTRVSQEGTKRVFTAAAETRGRAIPKAIGIFAGLGAVEIFSNTSAQKAEDLCKQIMSESKPTTFRKF